MFIKVIGVMEKKNGIGKATYATDDEKNSYVGEWKNDKEVYL